MRLFSQKNRNIPTLSGSGLLLRAPMPEDYPAWRALREQSAGFLIPWEPRWPSDDLTRGGYRRRLERYDREATAMTALTWFVLSRDESTIYGGITLSNIRHGAAHSGQIGYWMGAPHAGKGIMGKAVRLVLAEAFGTLGLERIEAACLPQNERSARLLEKAGFGREGYLRAYLEINGERRDHVLYAILRNDFAAISRQASQPGLNVAGIGH
ncbi:MAG TPA: GNAT family protein [Rhizobiaceae bacterium]|nr:GNAT family protein [Rhizobiaceae bacterium]